MTASADDYAWFRDYRRGSLHEMYCMTLVRGVVPDEFLARVGADPQGEFTGFDAFVERDAEFQDSQDLYGDFMFVGATQVTGREGPWTLLVEINGLAGTDHALMAPLSTGTRVVSHYRNVNALTYISWWEDGELRTRFERPFDRSGSTPDALVELMARVGISEESNPGSAEFLALAEELTGVRITAAVLDDAVYSTGVIEMPDEEWSEIVIDLRDASGERFRKVITREQVERAQAERRRGAGSEDIRDLATLHGIQVNERGRIPAVAVEQFEDRDGG